MKKIFCILAAMMILFTLCSCDLLGLELEETSSSSEGTSEKTTGQTQTESSTTGTTTHEETSTSGSVSESSDTSETNETTEETTEAERTDLVIFYTDPGGYLIPVTISVPKTFQVATESFNNMIRNSATTEFAAGFDLVPVYPEGTVINELSISNGEAHVDFNSKILEYTDKLEEYNIFSSTVYMLTGFSTVDTVRISIDGEYPGTLTYGAVINRPLSRNDVLINSNRFLSDPSKKKYDVYFIRTIENREFLVPVSVEFSDVSVLLIPGKMLNVLLTDYSEFGLYSQVPQGTEVIDASIDEDGILEVILSSELVSYGGGSAREIALLGQLLYTFSGVEGAEMVKLSIDGADDILPEGTELTEPFTVSKYINKLE